MGLTALHPDNTSGEEEDFWYCQLYREQLGERYEVEVHLGWLLEALMCSKAKLHYPIPLFSRL